MRAFVRLWDELTQDRYGVTDPVQRRFRYGVQVNSLGLTEAQPENNVQRIVLEMLAVTLSKDARARAVQLPAWNEALGLPRPWDQQWSLRIQQVLAYESDLLDYADIFTGSSVIEAKVADLVAGAKEEMTRIAEQGGAVAAVENGYMKSALVASHALRRQRIEAGEDIVVGVNKFETTEPNPLTEDLDTAIQTVDPGVEAKAALNPDAVQLTVTQILIGFFIAMGATFLPTTAFYLAFFGKKIDRAALETSEDIWDRQAKRNAEKAKPLAIVSDLPGSAPKGILDSHFHITDDRGIEALKRKLASHAEQSLAILNGAAA